MKKIATELHVIEKTKRNKRKVTQVEPNENIWITGLWRVSDTTAMSLIGGKIFVHPSQNKPSIIGGKVLSFTSNSNGRKSFKFIADPELSNIFATGSWGNEKLIVWGDVNSNNYEIQSEDESSSFAEGRKAYRLHLARERDISLAKKAKSIRLARTGSLKCDVCNFDFTKTYGALGDGYIEAHHTTPISELSGSRKTKLSELVLVCSNCHRMLHRTNPVLDVAGLKNIIKESFINSDDIK